jgi:uncharacterized membrane protein
VTDRTLRVAVGVLAAAGAAVAGYLVYARYTDTTLACATGGCETVQRSDYAVIVGVPVAVLGLLAYVALFATAFTRSEIARVAGAVIAVSGTLFAAYLLYAQVVVIDAVCQWCVTSDVLVLILAVACVLRLRSG